MKNLLLCTIILLAVGYQGCAMHNSPGVLVTHMKEAGTATESPDALNRGEACTTNVLGLIAVGDSSIDAAKKDGDISVVSSVDHQFTNILFFYAKSCTIVQGK